MNYFTTALLSVVVSLVSGETLCDILDKKCKTIDSCPTVQAVLKRKAITPTNGELDEQYRISRCGFEDKKLKVWCPGHCTAPDGRKGECLDLESCPALKKTINSHKRMPRNKYHKFLAKYRCSVPRDFYCCPFPSDAVNKDHGLNCSADSTALPPHPESGCCGIEEYIFRMKGGEPTNRFEWLALIEYRRKGFGCDGSLISERYVLTAAHCCDEKRSGRPWRVRLGAYNLRNPVKCTASHEREVELCSDGISDSLRIGVKRVIRHPRYRPDTHINDIALLRLQKMINLIDHVIPICMPCSDITVTPPAGLKLSLVGWDSERTSKQYLHVPYVDLKSCKTRYKNQLQLEPSHICAGGEVNRSDCAGDSGGPVMYQTGTHFQLVGIISKGPKQCGIEYPSIHTKVFEYLEWIKRTILKNDPIFGLK